MSLCSLFNLRCSSIRYDCVNTDLNGIAACNAGAVEALIKLSDQKSKRSSKFAAEALEKLFNYREHYLTAELTAKYWILNHLSFSNLISDGFYDFGSAGPMVDSIGTFPSLKDLTDEPIDRRREVLLIDFISDIPLSSTLAFLLEILPALQPEAQVRIVALVTSKLMGGPVEREKIQDYTYKFHISEVKLLQQSNVISLGQINRGTFYHRSLLFKALCDKVGLKNCSLTRGEYSRAWNTVDIGSMTLIPKLVPLVKRTPTSRGKSATFSGERLTATPTTLNAEQCFHFLGTVDLGAPKYTLNEEAIVDLMFEPGKLIPISSIESNSYQHNFGLLQ